MGARARPGTVPVTVVIAARNEATNIQACIDTLRWADEIIVADHGSSDATAAVASDSGATVLPCAAATIGACRNAAIETARNAWILVVDADERATADLAGEILRVIATAAHDAFRVPRRNFFLGREVKHGGWERDRPVRLFRSSLRYSGGRVHEHVITQGPVGEIAVALLHYPYSSLDEYFEKFDRYSKWWAEDQNARGRRASAAAVVLRPPARFFSMYFLRLGFLDGSRGVVLAALASASVLAKYARLWGLQCGS